MSLKGITAVAATNKPLTDEERQLMYDLATGVVAERSGVNVASAKDTLDGLAARGELVLRGDTDNAYLEAAGEVVIRVDRKWLSCCAPHLGDRTRRCTADGVGH